MTSKKYYPIIFQGFFEPLLIILRHFVKNCKKQAKKPNVVQASTYDNGYSCTCVLIIGAIVESFIQRLIMLEGIEDQISRGLHYCDVFKKVYPDENDFHQKMIELSIVRDSVSHNFMYDMEISKDFNIEKLERYNWSGFSGRYKNNVNSDALTTTTQQLNVLPTRIHVADVAKSIKIMTELLNFLHGKDARFGDFSNIGYQKIDNEFVSIEDELNNFLEEEKDFY